MSEEQASPANENLVTHLLALKKILMIGGLFWVAGFIVALFFQQQIFDFVLHPLENIFQGKPIDLLLIRPTDALVVTLKLCALASVIATSPVLFYLFWSFISPALQEKERRFTIWYAAAGLALALVGGLYAYFAMIPSSLQLLLGISPEGTNLSLTLMEYVDFLVFLFLTVILIFQTPIVVFTLVLANLVQAKTLHSKRREIYVGMLIGLAVLTPTPDIITLLFIAIPVVVLYELSIFLASRLSSKIDKNDAVTSAE